MPNGQADESSPVSTHAFAAAAPENEVREELETILASHEFRTSKRSQEFLRFIVETTLSGNANILKERTIGVEVFGRAATYDPGEDATVRVKASEVRKRLGRYYAEEGSHRPLRIELPAGTYIPEFRKLDPELLYERNLNTPVEKGLNGRMRPWIRPAAIMCLGVVLSLLLVFGQFGSPSATQRFWEPVLQGSLPVLLCAEHVPVYALDQPADSPVAPRAEDFTRLTDQFVGGGDLIAVSRLSGMLSELGRPYRVRIGKDVTFEDLRAAPAVLVGYSHTRWREISSQLRYFIDASRTPVMVTDNGSPTKWYLPNLPRDRRTSEDYAVVSRVFHPDTHTMLVELSGITQYGTEAASDLVTRPELLADALSNAPKGWEQKNLQFVLHVKVISGAPASPRVVATHVW
jgi:hypothetical protein